MVLEGLDRRSLGQLPPVDGVGSRRERIFFRWKTKEIRRKMDAREEAAKGEKEVSNASRRNIAVSARSL